MKKELTAILSGCMLIFYMGIIMYVFFPILHINILENYESAMFFEMIGFLLLTYFVMSSILSRRIKTGFFIPLIVMNIVYTIILNIVNIVCILTMPNVTFVLLNSVVLFIYCLVSMPMYIMGRR